MKVTDLMKIPGATYSIMGEEHAMAMWESMAKFSWVLQAKKVTLATPAPTFRS